ncbi:MAG: zinc ribbon domain-containing protein [Vallitaleaceae bacterium]|nr:zinc ribbon domain-containing protein [Vallitaleaceae bacterium]
MFCENCKAHLEEDALFCPECGTKVVNKVQEVHSHDGEAQTPVQAQTAEVQPQVVPVQPQQQPQPVPVPVQQQAVPMQPQPVPVQQQAVPVQPQPLPVQQQAMPVQQQAMPVQPQAPVQPQPMMQPQASTMMASQITDERNKPMSVGQYILTFIVMGLPIIGFIMTLVWAFSSTVNRNKKNFAIAVIVMFIIATALAVVSTIFLGAVIAELFDDIYYYL